MKRLSSVVILFTLILSSVISSFPQRSRKPVEDKAPLSAPVSFGMVEALTDGAGVLVRWRMESEKNSIGFYVYRIGSVSVDKELVNKNIVFSTFKQNGQQSDGGEEYSTYDPTGDLASIYLVENVLKDGSKVSSQTVSVTPVKDLLTASGASSERLSAADRTKSGEIFSKELVLTRELKKEVENNRALADINTQRWVASQPGVKIGIRKEGFYRVTRAELQATGFNTSGNSALWQLYTDGIEQAINIGPNADYIEFYGKGIDRIESDTNMYYLVNGPSQGKRINQQILPPFASSVTSKNYSQTFLMKQRTQYLDDIVNGDAENFWGDTISRDFPLTVNFNLSGIDYSAAASKVTIRIQGYPPSTHTVTLSLNGNLLPNATGGPQENFSVQYDIPTSYLNEGANALVLTSTTASDFSLFDQISINFPRKFLAVGNNILFYTQNYRAAKLEGFSSQNVRLFDITQDGNPYLITNANVVQGSNGYEVRIPPSRGRVFFAVEDSGLLQAASVLSNEPSTLSTTNHNANLVILSYKNWMTQAEAWANYRRGQGYSVEVVNVENVFDEFNFGVLSAGSVKDFLQFAKNNWQTPPQYVLLLGDGSFDSRNYQGFGFLNFIPVKIVNGIFSEMASDDALVDFNGDGLAEIAIGRIPAQDAQTVSDMLNKVTAFEQPQVIDLNRGFLFAYDNPIGFDFQGMSQRLRDQLPMGTPSTMVGRSDTNAHDVLINAINTGKYLVNYSGHGAQNRWAAADFFTNVHIPELTNANNRSIFTMLTCLNGYFHQPAYDGLAERLIKAPNGGAVAAWASSGLTTPDMQELMATRFFNRIGAGNITRLGDLILDAKSVVPGGADTRFSWVLIGDPMLKVR